MILEDRNEPFSSHPLCHRLRRRPLPASRASGSSSTRRQHAAAARSKAERGNARAGQAAQDGVRLRFAAFLVTEPRDHRFEKARGEDVIPRWQSRFAGKSVWDVAG
jgi:hypothetical protein